MAEKRLIDANALKKEIIDFKVNLHPQNQDYATGYFSGLSVVEGMLAYAPTVDAVEVVRCEDCRHFVAPQGVPVCDCFYGLGFPNLRGDDFCSYGERRTDGER